ncbi:hypothetical protein [Streptomyces sp. NPDC059788]|uniref:hypothetical protein n=1 Tax=Streptomyces sp. NPDC059788 TaxID=3346948 RepID=UPI00365B73E1
MSYQPLPRRALVYARTTAVPPHLVVSRLRDRVRGRGLVVRLALGDQRRGGVPDVPPSSRPRWDQRIKPLIEAGEAEVLVVRCVEDVAVGASERAELDRLLTRCRVEMLVIEPDGAEESSSALGVGSSHLSSGGT